LSKLEHSPEPLIRNISDTARWVAVYRARETERPDALFRDRFARRLAGERGEKIANSKPFGTDNAWSLVTRTVLMDDFIGEQIRQGTDMVVNLAAGLDARPYRMRLPARLQWVEVDLPEILSYKEEILKDEKPACSLERIRLDLSDVLARKEVFAELGSRAKKILLITEGLIIYLAQEEVASLARDLAAPKSFHSWILDLASPGLLRMLKKKMSKQLSDAAPFKFAPAEGPEFFPEYGWQPVEVHSLLKTAARLKRLPLSLRFFAMLPESDKSRRERPWSGVCRFERIA
jgi:methyltransferase (TIGR00027 family)